MRTVPEVRVDIQAQGPVPGPRQAVKEPNGPHWHGRPTVYGTVTRLATVVDLDGHGKWMVDIQDGEYSIRRASDGARPKDPQVVSNILQVLGDYLHAVGDAALDRGGRHPGRKEQAR